MVRYLLVLGKKRERLFLLFSVCSSSYDGLRYIIFFIHFARTKLSTRRMGLLGGIYVAHTCSISDLSKTPLNNPEKIHVIKQLGMFWDLKAKAQPLDISSAHLYRLPRKQTSKNTLLYKIAI